MTSDEKNAVGGSETAEVLSAFSEEIKARRSLAPTYEEKRSEPPDVGCRTLALTLSLSPQGEGETLEPSQGVN